MSHFAPPPGPPPPKVPEGWKAQYNEQYQEWFYINLITEKSQWERPTSPARVDSTVVPPPGPPPSYDAGPASGAALNASGDRKSGPSPSLGSNNPYSSRTTEHGSNSHIDEDARLAAQLQAEEDAQARRERGGPSPGTGGANTDYYSNALPPQHQQQQPYQQGAYTSSPRPEEQQRGKSGGFLGKLLGKGKHSSSSQQQYYQQPQGGYGYGGTPSGYAPGPGYGPGAGYYGQQQQYAQRPGRSGGGMGTAGAAALGVGGGLLGGMLLADAIDDHDDHDGGYDDGGYDNGGGDFGGDF